MPTLIRLDAAEFRDAEDAWTRLSDEDVEPDGGSVIVSLARLRSGEALGSGALGVALDPADDVEAIVAELGRLDAVWLAFPKFRDGRALSQAARLREQHGFRGEIRAVGDVLRDQAFYMVRCGFDAFAPADGATAEVWAHAARRHRHVYQRAADDRTPAFIERLA